MGNPGKKAFALSEFILAVGILGIVSLALVGLVLGAEVGSAGTAETMEASSLAQRFLKELKVRDFQSLETAIGSGITETRIYEGREYELSASISRLSSDNSHPDFKVLNLNVSAKWVSRSVDPGGKQRQASYHLQSHLSEVARY